MRVASSRLPKCRSAESNQKYCQFRQAERLNAPALPTVNTEPVLDAVMRHTTYGDPEQPLHRWFPITRKEGASAASAASSDYRDIAVVRLFVPVQCSKVG